MKVIVLGGGGQVGTAIGAKLKEFGHQVLFYRLPSWINIQGIPKRPKKPRQALEELKLEINQSTVSSDGYQSTHRWASEVDFRKADVLISTFPSYMFELLGSFLGSYITGAPILSISDRFLGSYAFLRSARRAGGDPRFCIAFGSPPILAYQDNQLGRTTLYYQKPVVWISCFPPAQIENAKQIVSDLFRIPSANIFTKPTLLHLAFDNIQSIVHAVQDLHNLKMGNYTNPVFLYRPQTYTQQIVDRINRIVYERDLIADAYGINNLRSLREFDNTTFHYRDSNHAPGSPSYRHHHPLLSELPAPINYKCHGYEDIGWSMVTTESFGVLANVEHVELTRLIDDWNLLMDIDYRTVGRTVNSLGLNSLGKGYINQIVHFFGL